MIEWRIFRLFYDSFLFDASFLFNYLRAFTFLELLGLTHLLRRQEFLFVHIGLDQIMVDLDLRKLGLAIRHVVDFFSDVFHEIVFDVIHVEINETVHVVFGRVHVTEQSFLDQFVLFLSHDFEVVGGDHLYAFLEKRDLGFGVGFGVEGFFDEVNERLRW
jgi:hypothetical protein